MPSLPHNKHLRILLLSLLISLFFSLPNLATLRFDGVNPVSETYALKRFFFAIVVGYISVVPLFYANLLGRQYLRTLVASRLIRLILVGIGNAGLIIILTGLGLALQKVWLDHWPLIGRVRRVYVFRNLIILGIVLLTVYIIELFQQAQQMQLVNAQLIEENAKAQLSVLKAQINPHFLFNSLNSLAAVIRTDRDESLLFVQKLSEVFRYLLRTGQNDIVTVGHELQFLDAYLFMLEKRFGNKLLVVYQLPETTYHRKIPFLALQPLIENAIKHNVISTARPLTVTIAATSTTLIVSNNIQPKRQVSESHGIGLTNLEKRYRIIGERSISIERSDHTFKVTLPLL